MAQLAVNVDHIATIREARKINYPDPVAAAFAAETAGADGIVVHLRGDRRHIQERDVRILRQTVRTKLILEMASTPEMLDIAADIKPDLVTLVPERKEEISTEGGLDIITHKDAISRTIEQLQSFKILVSIFIDPDLEQIKTAKKLNADMIEIHTGAFCDAKTEKEREEEFGRIVEAAKIAKELELGVNAGHGLCYHTIKRFRGLNAIDEFSIGHSIVARSTITGMEQAVRDMVALVREL
ncbi:pyridoxine 5'-phosphate synthase [Desulfamplus magnetovallimortis]|uniref:Pyridoxine 5'-phosphate synthase n=1 Tax=Desulfamplus magnetovallimortis TaxID=1246637 RepID=A0A1W1H973_9BACT|nr:pyridoxine 5'-phosphate synthase [Desulfamplus magnetovallimortis]SLM29027.1 pyridoxine 5'-phosphate synthase [Desulfamplus magnetovallimortis]